MADLPLDIERLTQRLDEMSQSRSRLEQLSSEQPGPDFSIGSDSYAIAAFHLRVIFEGAITIATHILARLPGQKHRATYASLLSGLGEVGIITQELAKDIERWAKLRNRLTHDYYLITGAELSEVMTREKSAIDQFIVQVNEHLATFPAGADSKLIN